MRKAISFNARWIDGEPAWDIALSDSKGSIHRGVKSSDIKRVVRRSGFDTVRQCDIQDYAIHHKQLCLK